MEPFIKIIDTELLSNNWYTLRKITYEYRKKDGTVEIHQREAYDRGNGATILLYNSSSGQVILTRQFRMPTFLNGNAEGMMIETCAGLLDKEDPEACIKREAEEETGYVVTSLRKVFEAYMSPGSVTELLHFFVAEYNDTMRSNDGGGIAGEQEYIEVMEIPFAKALEMVSDGTIKDAKTILLLQYARLEGLLK